MSDMVQQKTVTFPPRLSQRDMILVGILIALVAACFWPMWSYLPSVWFNKDGYYSHGILVPIISGYLIWMRQEDLLKTKIAPSWIGLPLLLLGLAGAMHAKWVNSQTVFQVSFFAFIFGGSLFLFGTKITRIIAFPLLFLGFMLPLPDTLFDQYTNSAQVISTKVADKYLHLMGFNTMMDQNNIIALDHYTLNVGIPCSGFKTSISLLTFGLFFMAIARLSWWKNLILLGSLLPIAIAINGLRIAAIGVVGEKMWIAQGEEAAHYWGNFTHDWSGYVLLVLAFAILFGIARGLGWKR